MTKKVFYFRNLVMIESIEPGALWEFNPQGGIMTLVDDDQFVQTEWGPDIFIPADPPEEKINT